MLMERFGYANIHQAPGIVKVAVNMGVGDAKSGPDAVQNMEAAVREMSRIVGQRPNIRKATKSIAQFGVREGMNVGCRATLRGARSWEFLDRLLNIALPRIRDFRGLNRNSFDGRGNYSLGLTDLLIFPELNSGNIGSKMLRHLARANAYGQILLGLDRPAADVSRGSSAHDVLGVAGIVGVQAIDYHLLYPGAGTTLPGD